MFEFKPSKETRSFEASRFVGKFFEIEYGHLSDDKKMQYLSAYHGKGLTNIHVSGWTSTQGEKGTKIRKKVVEAYLMEAMNGGRTDQNKYASYEAYFNKDKKKEVQEYWKGGLLGRMSRGGGDPDRVSLIVKFDKYELESSMWDLHAPEEWYSEMYKKDPRFQFKRGFYESREEAIQFFADKPHDDIFGTRYFPVLVFPKNTKEDINSILYGAKTHSKPIIIRTNLIFGTRCKPDEYEGVIRETYKAGGKIARACEWDWDG